MTAEQSTYLDMALASRWFAVPDDLIGGWAIATVDQPVSSIDTRARRDIAVVGDFLDESIARHVAELHNAALDGGQ